MRRLSRSAPQRWRLPFAARLALALAFALAASSLLSYTLLHHRLRHDALRSDARTIHADARTFEALGRGRSQADAMADIVIVLRAVAARPGVKEATLIASDY